MRTTQFIISFLIVLFHFSQIMAEEPASTRVYECRNEKGFERRLEVRYEKPGAAVPCRVVWYRGDVAGGQNEHVMRVAKHQAGKCEESEKSYLEKMKRWGVRCELQKEKTAEAPKVIKPVAQEPKKESAPAEVRKGDWVGSYAGFVLGTQFGKSRTKTGNPGYNGDDEKWDYSETGLNAGLQYGQNYQWGRVVAGPEFEIGYLELKGEGSQPSSPGGDSIGKSSGDLYAMLRARVGFDYDRNLVFAAGGLLAVNEETSLNDNCNVAPCGGTTVSASKKGFNLGYTLGAGVEHLFEQGWSAKLEYLYFTLNEQKFSGTTNLGTSYDWTGQTTGNIIRGGLQYRF